MATACSSPSWRRDRRPSNDDRDDGASVVQLGSTGATPERPSSHNTASPEDSCAICLGSVEKKSSIDSCLHAFCFVCITEWAKVKAECPLCKQRFEVVIHSVRSLEDYDACSVSERQHTPTTTMTVGRQEESERMQQHQWHPRHVAIVAQSRRYLAWCIDQGARTSAERRELYGLDLWAVPSRYSLSREASPHFYRENLASTHRLFTWLDRELQALMSSQSHVQSAMDVVMSLILDYDIRHPAFATALRPFLVQHVEHFIHEFYLFATSIHHCILEYDWNTVYTSRSQAHCQGDPVGHVRATLLEPATPQPGPSGLEAARQEMVTTLCSDSDSDSSDCILVKVVKPNRESTPVVIELLTSDDEEAL